MVRRIIEVARTKNLKKVYATVLKTNSPMKKLAKKLGFKVEATDDVFIDSLNLIL